MIIGYTRVGTDKLALKEQLDALTAADCIQILEEEAIGRNMPRPQLQYLFEILRPGDKVVVWKLNIIAKNLFHLHEIIEFFTSNEIDFVSLSDGLDTSTVAGRNYIKMLRIIVDFEKDITHENSIAGLTIARARGKRGGRPQKPKRVIDAALKMYHSNRYSIKEICKECNVSKTTLYRYIENENL